MNEHDLMRLVSWIFIIIGIAQIGSLILRINNLNGFDIVKEIGFIVISFVTYFFIKIQADKFLDRSGLQIQDLKKQLARNKK